MNDSLSIFVAGATGVIGVRLVPLLIAEGHQVAGMTRSPAKAGALQELGARPVVCDVFAREQLVEVVCDFAPDVVVHQLTDLPDHVQDIPAHAEANDRIRTEGTRNLIAAAQAAGARHFLAQSIAWTPPGRGAVVAEHERLTLEADGVVVRYGQLYGPGTYYEAEPPEPPRIHVDEAARATVPLITAPSGVVVLSDQA